MKDKLGIVLGAGIVVAVLATLMFYILNAGNIELSEIFPIFIVIILVIIAAIWGAVFVPLVIDILFDYELPGHLVTGVVVLCGGLVFMISYMYLAWKGN